MITFEQFKTEMQESGVSDDYNYESNYNAAVRFIKAFRCEHVKTYAEAKKIILDSMDMISDDLYENEFSDEDNRESYSQIFRKYGDPSELGDR